jgi:hypothetical protein
MVENLAVLSLMQKYLLLYWNPASRYVDRMMESPRAWEELKKWKSLYGTQRQRNSLQWVQKGIFISEKKERQVLTVSQ